jgi:EAL domain-containing protein (putative c-di-GMP-specific phosphodiesterase class I)
VHQLKIDSSFIGAVAKTPRNAAIVKSTITLCHALGLSVVGEGVETEDLAWLAAKDCDAVQGYAVARPMPPEELPAWWRISAKLAANRRKTHSAGEGSLSR